VVVFLGVLLLLHLAAHRLACTPAHAWVPLLPYAGVMLLVPLLRGAHQRPGFWVHAGIVAGALLVAAVASVALRHETTTSRAADRAAARSPAVPNGRVARMPPAPP